MKNPLPEQLHNTEFKFFLAQAEQKKPFERLWNSTGNYNFFEEKLITHIRAGGNVGVCTGYGRLIVIDFDNAQYQKLKEKLLPRTFTIKTAGKGLKHFYYLLKGEMIKKIGIGLENRICDIQAGRCGVMTSPSKIGRRFYSVVEDRAIEEIDRDLLTEVFNIKSFRRPSNRINNSNEIFPEKIQETIELLLKLGVPRTKGRHFKCPFHNMEGAGNMHVNSDGGLYCFHCMRGYSSAKDFKSKWEAKNGGIVIQ